MRFRRTDGRTGEERSLEADAENNPMVQLLEVDAVRRVTVEYRDGSTAIFEED